MKRLLIIFGCCFISLLLSSQENIDLKKTVAFIFIKNKEKKLSPIGTGFFIGIKGEKDSSKTFVYLITAKHVLQDKNKKFFNKIYLRLNTKSGIAREIPILLYQKDKPVFVNSIDKTADVVAIPFLPDINRFDFKLIPNEMIATSEMIEEFDIREGDEALIPDLKVNTMHFAKHLK